MRTNFEIRVDSKAQLEDRLTLLGNRIRSSWDEGHPLALTCKEWREARSTNQNNLYWQWVTDIAKDFTERGSPQTKDDIHDALRYKFLGVETHQIGDEKIRRLPSTTRLDKGRMAEYMNKVEAWAFDHGVLLLVPADNEYKSYREASQ